MIVIGKYSFMGVFLFVDVSKVLKTHFHIIRYDWGNLSIYFVQ